MKSVYTLFLKTGTVCNAGCISCPAGRKLPEDKEFSGNMTPGMLTNILEYIQKQGRITSCVMHYYNEPTINPDIAELVKISHEHGIHCIMSTNGSFPDKLMKVMEQGLTQLIFSVSGWTDEIHQRSHKYVKIETVKQAMRMVSDYINKHRGFRNHKQFVRVSWHDYEYNKHEKHLMQQFSELLGFKFVSYNTGLLPLERAQARMKEVWWNPDSLEDIGERDLVTKLKEAAQLCFARKHWTCIHQERFLVIDAEGYIHNCAGKVHLENRRGLLFDTNLEEFNRFRKEEDADCKNCKSYGHHIYAMQSYREPLTLKTEIKKKLEDGWRALGLGGIFPSLVEKYSQVSYHRPNK